MKLLSSFILVIVIAGFSNYPHIQSSPKKGTKAAAVVVVLCAVETSMALGSDMTKTI